ncbi:outer membrane lipid asymmetry maintenance protein MlaD [Pseudoruegeria sp. SK021]|uniref:outer membrane lipid asymmetry maintenance protein MlaD n=1 Tax=Pseudoruegeria sp. SK021 TaxID=1933035 RepID=UPI000A239873|nr:outer membrane lipid asymmetry maintenance protein MlaD [Pseudoruegeria sp. SK021]OSP54961.1 outer membrane lipid asymmetry maintenance protein MlaD [Pseudoruegeria sp. SK021]
MAENKAELLVGGLVILVAAGFLTYASRSVGGMSASSGYELTASFRSAQGISVGTDVRLAGVKVGTVAGLSLNPQTFRADATISVADGIVLPDDSSIIIASEGLLGGNFVELQPGGSLDNFNPGDEIESTQGSISLIELLSKFVGGSG